MPAYIRRVRLTQTPIGVTAFILMTVGSTGNAS